MMCCRLFMWSGCLFHMYFRRHKVQIVGKRSVLFVRFFHRLLLLSLNLRSLWSSAVAQGATEKNCGAVEAAVCFATARSCGERCLADALGSYGTLAWSMCFRYCGLSALTAIATFPLYRGALFVMVSLSLSRIISVNLTHVLIIVFLYV